MAAQANTGHCRRNFVAKSSRADSLNRASRATHSDSRKGTDVHTLLAILLILVLLGGIALIYNGWKDRRDPTAPQRHRRSPIKISRRNKILLVAGVLVGGLTWMVSGWFIALPLGPVIFVGLPFLLGKPAAEGEIARLNAMEEWVRNLSGVLAVGTGIEQAIIATHKAMPEALTTEISRLIQRLRTNAPIIDALRGFADDLDDATGDLIVGSLIQSAAIRGSGLTAVLDRLSRSVAEDVRNRRGRRSSTKRQSDYCSVGHHHHHRIHRRPVPFHRLHDLLQNSCGTAHFPRSNRRFHRVPVVDEEAHPTAETVEIPRNNPAEPEREK